MEAANTPPHGSEEGGKEGGTLKQLTALLEVKRPPLLHLSAQLLSYILALGFTAPYVLEIAAATGGCYVLRKRITPCH